MFPRRSVIRDAHCEPANMPPSARSRLCPWVEELILSYGTEPGTGTERLKARVVRVEQMSQSQAHNSDCPTGLLLLSDGSLLMPAVLTTAAWERLQEQEDRDSFDGLVNSTVLIQDFRLQFHMAQEQTKCRFFLSVGELAVTSAGPCGSNTPCCTTLASVRQKIRQTWRDLLDEQVQDSQSSQSGFELTMLLGEWHQDCMLSVLKDVEERLTKPPCRPASPQPSTSATNPARPHPSEATGWDVDRLRFKTEKSFSIPVKCLLIPDVLQLQAAENAPSQAPDASSGPEDGESLPDRVLPQPPRPPATEDPAAFAETEPDAADNFPPSADHMIGDLSDGSIRPLSNPWDIFTPPGVSPCSSDASPGEPLQSQDSCLPPYQRPPQVDLRAAAAGLSEVFSRAAQSTCGSVQLQASAEQLPVSEETGEAKVRRKRREPAAVEAGGQDDHAGRSPPSWLFDTLTDCGVQEDHQHHPDLLRKTPSVHSDGRSFSYSYRVSDQDLWDLSHFQVQAAWLQWALGYLLGPEKIPGPVCDHGPCEQTEVCTKESCPKDTWTNHLRPV